MLLADCGTNQEQNKRQSWARCPIDSQRNKIFHAELEQLLTLPLWGKDEGKPFDFEWPTQYVLDTMDQEKTLKAIEFKTASGKICLSFVQLHLSDG